MTLMFFIGLNSLEICGVVVQWLDYLAVMQESGIRFPTAVKVTN